MLLVMAFLLAGCTTRVDCQTTLTHSFDVLELTNSHVSKKQIKLGYRHYFAVSIVVVVGRIIA